LIQCAGDGDGEEIDKLDWGKTQETFTLNAIAPIILTSKLLPLIKENKADVINVGATIALKAYQYFSVYGSSKGAFRMWTENLQLELKGTSSRVIGVYPGGMNTK
jgi:3-oxoacyl-[acyl-carrier protein] reductase